ncbi:MAG: hypothetical protein HY868_02640 [Chloroflexi bacterium]|nr:hypothetical protein [Chloroflexota bacterium]
MLDSKPRYASFLLRLRRMQTENRHTWVASVQSTMTGDYYSFPNLDALVQFLQTEFGECEIAAKSKPAVQNQLGRDG